ncbi:breast cancer type 1 susceptibility protein [Crotalus adamanteus]|uniref:RING-type E3 ubiquitin transferase n=1 Tax=Crotalus adamanteus TaxID=8729 RepID=A0AAW1B3W2_CROAD
MDLPVPSVREVHELLLALQKNLECPICLEVIKEPVSTNCAHNFCRSCVFKLLKLKKGVTQCPLCNAKVTKRSLKEDTRLKEVVKEVLETIHAFECDTGLKFSDDLCYPKKVIETVSASTTCKNQLIINSKGYRDRWKYMKKEEKRNTELGDGPVLPQYNGNETRYFLRKKRNSSKTMVLQIGSDSSEDIFQKGNMGSCMGFESPSFSQVNQDHIVNWSQSSCHIEHSEPSAKNEASLNIIDICGALEGRKLGSRDDTETVNENLKIVEENMTVKQQEDIPLDSCMEQSEKLPSLSGNNKVISHIDEVSSDTEQLKCGQEEYAHSESNLGEEMMPYASETTHLEDSLGQFSQSEILTTQQRDAMQNNLKKLQQKMAIIEAVLKQGSQNVGPEGWSQEGEETDFKRDKTETRKKMHTVLEKPVSPLAHTTCCSTKQRNRKNLLWTGGQKMSLVASGLNQSELQLVRKFAKKTESTWSNKITEETTHVIIKTDEDLVCERTLKYFIGIAAQKWVLSYQWIIQSLEAGRVLKEEDFEVRGDVINGENHQGPKRARESPVGKLFQGLEICCYGPFTDMLPEQLEWIVELCGASLVKQPHLFAHATNSTAVIVIQPDAWTEESTCQELPLQCSIAVVSREWVLDSVACYQCQSFNDYIFQQEPSSMSE